MKKRHIALMVFFFGSWIFLSMLAGGGKGGSSFSAEPQGAKAFYLLLEAEGLKPNRFFHPFTELEKQGIKGVLFVIAPDKVGGEKALKSWISAGNTLVLFNSTVMQTLDLLNELELVPKQSMLAESIGSTDFWNVPESISLECSKHAACTDVRNISRSDSALPASTDAELLCGTAAQARVFRRAIGAGEVWVFSGAEPVWNQNIDRFDNLRLLYQLAGTEGQVTFDEFHHGYVAPVAPENKGGFQSIILALVYLSAAALIAALSRAVRLGPPTVEGPQESLASTDFAAVLGLLYSERGARSTLRNYVAAWRSRIEKRFGVSRRLPHEAMLTELHRDGVISDQGVAGLKEQLYLLEEPGAQRDAQLEQAVSELERLARNESIHTALNQERHQ